MCLTNDNNLILFIIFVWCWVFRYVIVFFAV